MHCTPNSRRKLNGCNGILKLFLYRDFVTFQYSQVIENLWFCFCYKMKGVVTAQNLTIIIKAPWQMSHIPIDLDRRERVKSECVDVCMCVTQFFVTNNSWTTCRINVLKAAFFLPCPKTELFHRLVNTRCVFRSFNRDLSIFSQILNAILLTKTTFLVTFQYRILIRDK